MKNVRCCISKLELNNVYFWTAQQQVGADQCHHLLVAHKSYVEPVFSVELLDIFDHNLPSLLHCHSTHIVMTTLLLLLMDVRSRIFTAKGQEATDTRCRKGNSRTKKNICTMNFHSSTGLRAWRSCGTSVHGDPVQNTTGLDMSLDSLI